MSSPIKSSSSLGELLNQKENHSIDSPSLILRKRDLDGNDIWQVEDLPLLGLYYVEADSRAQQLEVLKKWIEQKSVLLFWCKQFSFIACDKESSLVFITCQEVLLKQLSTLIPDEGHTPKNEDIDVLQSLPKVQIELVKKTEISTELRESGTGEALIDLGPVGTEGVNDASAADPDQGA
ncbi:hypothetical protein Q3G72_034710 [Acer saccharum]|nr:hypothetical protein Q3G72_034710 [Acer saccharum]